MAYVIIDDPVGGINSTVRCDNNNAARCNYSTVLGGYSNTANSNYGIILLLLLIQQLLVVFLIQQLVVWV